MVEPHRTPEGLIASFRADLQAMIIGDFIRKHISTGQPCALTDEEYYHLRRQVAGEFLIHPSAVVVVGSSRTGFSLNPSHRFRPLQQNSDIDVAIISEMRFDEYWDRVFEYSQDNPDWTQAKIFKKNLFNGWIDPRSLPSSPYFDLVEKWVNFFDGMMSSRQFGLRRITARLYRTWNRLEAYQKKSVNKCKQALLAQE